MIELNIPFSNIATGRGSYIIGDESIDVEEESNQVSVDLLDVTAVNRVDKSVASIGEELTYTVEITNNSSFTIYNCIVRDNLPSNVKLLEESLYEYCDGLGNLSEGINIGRIASGKSREINFSVVINNDTTDEIINYATVNFTFDDFSCNSFTKGLVTNATITSVMSNSLEIFKKADKTFVSSNGEEVNYTITVTNSGISAINDITVTDVIPSGMTYKEGSTIIDGQSPIDLNPACGIEIGSLAGGDSTEINFITIVNL